jgi:HD superfamily phosphohydrolase
MSENDILKIIISKLENLNKIKFSIQDKKINEDLKNILENLDIIDKKYKEKIKKLDKENILLKNKVSELENIIDYLNFEKFHNRGEDYISFDNIFKKEKSCFKCCSIV